MGAESRNTLLIALVILSLVELCCFSPLSSIARELKVAGNKLFRKITQVIVIFLALVFGSYELWRAEIRSPYRYWNSFAGVTANSGSNKNFSGEEYSQISMFCRSVHIRLE